MRWRRTGEEREAARAEAEAKRARRAEARRQDAYAASPIGQAEAAAERGDRFLEIREDSSSISGAQLEEIEDAGWQLENVGYVFVQTGSTTTVDSSGDSSTHIYGSVQGIYLFRSHAQESPRSPRSNPQAASAAAEA